MYTTRFEDGTAALMDFAAREHGQLDGAQAAKELNQVMSRPEAAYGFVADPSRRNSYGYYEVLRPADTPERFAQANALLGGRVVIAPLPEAGRLHLYPAIVSIDGLTNPGQLKLHILRNGLMGGLTEDQRILLSAAAQSELPSVGRHEPGRLDAEHFLTVLRAATDEETEYRWRAGQHPNHNWRQAPGTSVLSVISTATKQASALLPDRITTLTLTQERWPGGFTLYWHENLRAGDQCMEEGARPDALLMVQGIGFLAMHEQKKTSLVTELTQLDAARNGG